MPGRRHDARAVGARRCVLDTATIDESNRPSVSGRAEPDGNSDGARVGDAERARRGSGGFEEARLGKGVDKIAVTLLLARCHARGRLKAFDEVALRNGESRQDEPGPEPNLKRSIAPVEYPRAPSHPHRARVPPAVTLASIVHRDD